MTAHTLSAPAPTSRQSHRISADDAADMLMRHREGVLPALALFDVRDEKSYLNAHIAGATRLAEATFPLQIRGLSRSVPVLVYCYHGNASQTYAQWFADFRFPEVYSVDGGYPAFAAALALRDAERADAAMAGTDASAGLLAFLAEFGFDALDLDAPRQHGLTPLMRAALAGRADLIDELLRCGADVGRRNMDGNNALWLACVSSNADSVRKLVQAGIDIDNRNDMGATCLMYTASAGKAEMVALLLECGADPQIMNFDDARAVDLAATRTCLQLLRHTIG
ncbi:ankyrin repeat domain-containing protein [Azoarcus sp. L1K30]|uniref:ankyrin repeat domain-containing protein n=1 Tax=Azoarcus sp. L1K30 TaxID=2820277 RepID=UPI001B836287|nr:ankyrin repeat domain-containing protein [Azoarcus sp. L1K30]MBR0566543.1 ankyrin repeat domain-containing protein [Azoarcus sp. L1K30]